MILGAFSASALGMMAQSKSLASIGLNISNVNTGGYKRTDTNFQTVLGKTMSEQSDIGGVVIKSRTLVAQQGLVTGTGDPLNVAISGQGMFVMNTMQDGSGDTLYGRDGNFHQTYGTNNEGYLVDKNGLFVQGWAPATDGSFNTATQPSSLRIDGANFLNNGLGSTFVETQMNLNASTAIGGAQGSTISAHDSSGALQSIALNWTKTGINAWSLSVTSLGNGTVATPAAPVAVTFNTDSTIASPTNITVAGSFNSVDPITGASVTNPLSVDLDLSRITQFSGPFVQNRIDYDGHANARLSGLEFSSSGELVGRFDDSTLRVLYKLPLAQFPNVNGLTQMNGNVWREGMNSGPATLIAVGAPSGTGITNPNTATFKPFSLEKSNVDLAEEFADMIITQQAYNSAATVFRAADEMISQAAGLKT